MEQKQLIEKAIEYHGRKDLPPDLDGRCLLLSKLIRDADCKFLLYLHLAPRSWQLSKLASIELCVIKGIPRLGEGRGRSREGGTLKLVWGVVLPAKPASSINF